MMSTTKVKKKKDKLGLVEVTLVRVDLLGVTFTVLFLHQVQQVWVLFSGLSAVKGDQHRVGDKVGFRLVRHSSVHDAKPSDTGDNTEDTANNLVGVAVLEAANGEKDKRKHNQTEKKNVGKGGPEHKRQVHERVHRPGDQEKALGTGKLGGVLGHVGGNNAKRRGVKGAVRQPERAVADQRRSDKGETASGKLPDASDEESHATSKVRHQHHQLVLSNPQGVAVEQPRHESGDAKGAHAKGHSAVAESGRGNGGLVGVLVDAVALVGVHQHPLDVQAVELLVAQVDEVLVRGNPGHLRSKAGSVFGQTFRG